ncbi:hypothetical protein ACXR2T_02295 [Leucobacter sp. HY1910]
MAVSFSALHADVGTINGPVANEYSVANPSSKLLVKSVVHDGEYPKLTLNEHSNKAIYFDLTCDF